MGVCLQEVKVWLAAVGTEKLFPGRRGRDDPAEAEQSWTKRQRGSDSLCVKLLVSSWWREERANVVVVGKLIDGRAVDRVGSRETCFRGGKGRR